MSIFIASLFLFALTACGGGGGETEACADDCTKECCAGETKACADDCTKECCAGETEETTDEGATSMKALLKKMLLKKLLNNQSVY